MRDVRNLTQPYFWQVAEGGSVYTSESGQMSRYRSQRSESQSTFPLQGKYVRPTPYNSFFATCVPSTYHGEWQRQTLSGFWLTNTVDGTGYPVLDVEIYGVGATNLAPIMSPGVSARAHQQAIDAMRGTDLSAAVSLLELRELNSLMKQILGFIPESLRAIRRGTKAKHLASAYLAYLFGIAPMIQDAYAVAEVIQNGLTGPIGHVKAVQMDSDYPLPVGTDPNYREITGSVRRGIEVSYTFTARNATAFQLWKYGLTNPLSWAWELTTLSFVVDWFTGLGNFIDALDANIYIDVLHGYETTFLENRLVVRDRMTPIPGDRIRVTQEAWSETTIHTKAMNRQVLGAVVPPTPYLKLGLNAGQMVSGIALMLARAK